MPFRIALPKLIPMPLCLGEVNGLRRLPIVIGGFEAQAIAVALEKMQPSRPLTHDLMKNFMNAL